MAETSPRLHIPYIAQSQAQKEVTHSQGVDVQDILIQLAFKDRDLAAPPGSPALGDTYLVAASPTGAWSGHAGHVAAWISLQWKFSVPLEGWWGYVQDEDLFVVYTGSAWVPITSGATFLALPDTPDSYTGQAGKVVSVNPGGTALEFATPSAGVSDFLALTDTPDSYAGQAGTFVKVNAGGTALEFGAGTVGTFLNLSDTPDTYTGQGGKVVSVKSDASGVEFIPQASGTLGLHRGALLAMASDQAIGSATPTVLTWGSATYDTSSLWSAGQPTRLVVPAGVSRFMAMAQVELDGVSVGIRRLRILHNGTTVAGQGTIQQPVESSSLTPPHVVLSVQTPPLAVSPGDYLEVEVLQDTGVSLQALAGVQTWFAGMLISEMGSGGASTFLELGDTPDAYTGQAGKAVLVNAGATGLEFGTPTVGATTFVALTDTPDSYAGQAGKGVVVNPGATGLDFTTALSASYDLGGTWAGTLPASQVLLRYPFPRSVSFPAGLSGSYASAVVAAMAQTDLDIRKNGVSIGTMRFAAAATVATFLMASAQNFVAGDVLSLHAPASPDSTLATVGWSLAGTRTTAPGEMGATTYLALLDTPDAYTGQGGNLVTVNLGATALDFTPLTAAGRALLDDADNAVQRATLGLGTLAVQDASAVAITDGRMSLGGHAPTGVLDVQGSVQESGSPNTYNSIRIWPVAPLGATGVRALRVEAATGAGLATTAFRGLVFLDQPTMLDAIALSLQISAGAGRYNINASGTAPSYFAGNVGMGTSPTNNKLEMSYNRAAESALVIRTNADSGAGFAAIFFNAASGIVGNINTTATATNYVTSSDRRLKRNITPLANALATLRRLRPVSYVWNSTEEIGHGFLADEVQTVIAEAVTGMPDQVDAQGNLLPQGMDHSKLVPWLTGAVQEIITRLEALEEALGV